MILKVHSKGTITGDDVVKVGPNTTVLGEPGASKSPIHFLIKLIFFSGVPRTGT